MMTPRRFRRWLVASILAVAAIVVGSCNLHNPGVTAPAAVLSYPSALALSREPELGQGPAKYLYVANSNFDLRYNSGSMQSYSLEQLDVVLKQNRCRTFGSTTVSVDADGNATPIDAGTRVFSDNTNYAMLGLLDAGLGDASMSLTGAGDAGADAGSDGGGVATSDAGSLDAGLIVLPGDYDGTSSYGNARGFLCDGEDPPGYEGCCLDSEGELDAVRRDAYKMDSFAVGVAVAPDNQRVYVPISSRNQLLYFDVANGVLGCGDDPALSMLPDGGVAPHSGRCRRGPDRKSDDNVQDDDFPGQLSEITIGTLADLIPAGSENGIDRSLTYLATTHELGAVGLFVVPQVHSDPNDTNSPLVSGAPILNATVNGLGQRPRSVSTDPRKNLLYVTSAGESYVSRVGVRVNPLPVTGEDAPPRELLYETSRITVTGVSQANDLRDVAVDPTDPNKLYVLIRGTQESVGFLQVDPTVPSTNARLIDEVRIGAGPSKMILIQQDGKSFLLVTCYDSKALYVIDVATRLLVAVVRSFSGPFTMSYDAERKLLHVADFRASIMRVVDLEGITNKRAPPPRIVLTIGSPQFEGALQ